LALVFAELTPGCHSWHQALKGWNMLESPTVLEWQAQARQEGILLTQRANLLRLLERRFPVPLPADLATQIAALTDGAELLGWFDAAAIAPSLDAFRTMVHPGAEHAGPNGAQSS
jgi:hypothetical protein